MDHPEEILGDKFEVRTTTAGSLASLIETNNVVMQEKHDGRFVRLDKVAGAVELYDKHYERVYYTPSEAEPQQYEMLVAFARSLPGYPWTLLGELMKDGSFIIFQVARSPRRDLNKMSMIERLCVVDALVNGLGVDEIKVSEGWSDKHEKVYHYDRLREAGAEGVVFTSGISRYKYKFLHSVDAIVITKRPDGRSAVALALMDDKVEHLIGKCGVPESVLAELKPYDVIEVRYRSVSQTCKLIEPVFMRVRTDKRAYECELRQILMQHPSRFAAISPGFSEIIYGTPDEDPEDQNTQTTLL